MSIAAILTGLSRRKNGKTVNKKNAHGNGIRKSSAGQDVYCLDHNEKKAVQTALHSIEKNGVISGDEVLERLDRLR